LLPQIAADAELHDDRVKLLRFRDPEPGRTIGLVWRRTSPRRKDFEALGVVIVAAIDGAKAERGRLKRAANA
jgi:LysR family hydrogen peroxide-inducible transcriptional activator